MTELVAGILQKTCWETTIQCELATSKSYKITFPHLDFLGLYNLHLEIWIAARGKPAFLVLWARCQFGCTCTDLSPGHTGAPLCHIGQVSGLMLVIKPVRTQQLLNSINCQVYFLLLDQGRVLRAQSRRESSQEGPLGLLCHSSQAQQITTIDLLALNTWVNGNCIRIPEIRICALPFKNCLFAITYIASYRVWHKNENLCMKQQQYIGGNITMLYFFPITNFLQVGAFIILKYIIPIKPVP